MKSGPVQHPADDGDPGGGDVAVSEGGRIARPIRCGWRRGWGIVMSFCRRWPTRRRTSGPVRGRQQRCRVVHDGLYPLRPTVRAMDELSSRPMSSPSSDGRELVTVHATEIDVDGLGVLSWGRSGIPGLVYLRDISDYGVETLAGFRLVNGQRLAVRGIERGDHQCALCERRTTTPCNRVPAMLAADAVTLLVERI